MLYMLSKIVNTSIVIGEYLGITIGKVGIHSYTLDSPL